MWSIFTSTLPAGSWSARAISPPMLDTDCVDWWRRTLARPLPLCHHAVGFEAAVCDDVVAIDILNHDIGTAERTGRITLCLFGRRAPIGRRNLFQLTLVDDVRQTPRILP
jgi:hypothetical protein